MIFSVRIKADITEFETHLVVAFAGGAVAYRVGALLSGDTDLLFGNDRPCQRGAEQVGTFINGIGPKAGKI